MQELSSASGRWRPENIHNLPANLCRSAPAYDIALMSIETKLTDGIYSPIYVSRNGGTTILKSNGHIIRLGEKAAQWLFEALQLVANNQAPDGSSLSHFGEIVLSVSSNFPFTFISGKNTRITISYDVLLKLIKWLSDSK